MGYIINQIRIATGIDTLAYSNLLNVCGIAGRYCPMAIPITIHKAGYEATRAIELEYSYRVRDFSGNYRGYSDLNDYLCGRKQEQKNSTSQAQEIKQETGQRAAPRQKRGRGI